MPFKKKSLIDLHAIMDVKCSDCLRVKMIQLVNYLRYKKTSILLGIS